MIGEMFKWCVYQEPSSIVTTTFCGFTLLALIYLGISEAIGNHLLYSKFWNLGSGKSSGILLSSRNGMLLLYTPAFLAGFVSFILFPDGGIRFMMLKSAVTLHFLKRDLEVLFLHKYSGSMVLDSAILISLIYLGGAAGLVFFQEIARGYPEPLVDLKYAGVLLFVVGILGNFYHHYLLTKLREKREDKGYKIPRGGLFGLVICPHYLFEIFTFIGFSLISQTLFSYVVAIGVVCYLSARSYVTREWYVSKFDNFPKNVKALIPYVF